MKGVKKYLKLTFLVFCLEFGLFGTYSVALADVTVNVKTDLGPLGCPDGNAAGDGVTNDDAPINWAIDYVISHGGGTVYCPAGTYRVERVYHDNASVDFIGDGMDLTIFRPHPDSETIRLFDFRGGLLKDLTIYGTYPEDSGENWVCGGHEGPTNGIVATDITSKCLIKNVRVLEVKTNAFYCRDSKGLWVVDCEFDKAGVNVVAIDPDGGTTADRTEEFVFANCKIGPYRGSYVFNIEPTGDEYVRNGVILNCKFLGTDSGEYGTNINLWGCFASFKGTTTTGSGDRRNIAVVGCDLDNVWIHTNESFPDMQFSYNRINGDYPIFARSLGTRSVLADAIVQGNYFVGKEYWSQIASGTSFTGNSALRCNTPSGANWESCSWSDCNAADIALLESASNVEDLSYSDLKRLCTNCPRRVLEHFYSGVGDWPRQAAYSELDDMQYEWLREPIEPNSEGVIGWWKLDGDANDSSGNGNNGGLVGNATYDTGKFGQAIKLDGVDDYVRIDGNESDYDLTDAITVAAWIKMTTLMYEGYNKTRNIVAKGDSAWKLYMWSESRVKFHCSGLSVGTQYAMGGVDVADRQWHHVAGVYDGSYLSVYIDGMLEDSLPATGSISTNDYKVAIGENLQVSNEWKNLIDDVRIYNYALSEEEMMYLAGLRKDLSEDGYVNFADFAVLGNDWLKEEELWPWP